ncbi:MAG: hypothetical protein QXV17_11320 [Candidatus Micrarchaeaceae archaeon]
MVRSEVRQNCCALAVKQSEGGTYDATNVYQELRYDDVKGVITVKGRSTDRRSQKTKNMANGGQ